MGHARPARTRVEIELEVRVAPRGFGGGHCGFLGERRAPEIRVEDDPSGVDHRPEARHELGLGRPCRFGGESAR